jgi:putative ABC transport system substrate-binding protein
VRRREFITLLGGAAAWPLVARAQQNVRRLGVLSNTAESDAEAQSMVAALRQELRRLGWIDGRNLHTDHRWAAGNAARLQALSQELVALQPDVVVAHTSTPVFALRKETENIPIVFVQVADPIGSGFVANLARPDGNVTGFTSFESSMPSKWAEMLKEIAPETNRIGFLFNPETAPYVRSGYFQAAFEAVASSYGIKPAEHPVHSPRELESAIIALARESGAGLMVMPDAFNIVHRERIIELAAQHRLPTVYPYRFAVKEGGLLSYGVDQVDSFRRAAIYVDRLFKGEKPGELPVQTPIKFELAVNVKTAAALGLTVPSNLLIRADEVIE